MEIKETSSKTMEAHKTIEDSNYFKYIFKKTEKISCAVFYILRGDVNVSQSDMVIQDLEDSARLVLDVSLESLRSTDSTLGEEVSELRFVLIELESKLRVAHAARYISTDILSVFMHEIDSVYRAMKKYTEGGMRNPLSQDESPMPIAPARKEPVRVREQKEVGQVGVSQVMSHAGRRERIIDILRDNPEATIKDIVAIITDCSEKTIQRELISLIKDNVVVREGERRWSKYKLV